MATKRSLGLGVGVHDVIDVLPPLTLDAEAGDGEGKKTPPRTPPWTTPSATAASAEQSTLYAGLPGCVSFC